VTANYLIILTTEKGMDNIEVQVEISPEAFSDQVKVLETLQKNITKAVESVIGLRIRVKLVAPQTIARSEGKAKRVLDQRIKN
jgi:phenylacetate-CoA ligase